MGEEHLHAVIMAGGRGTRFWPLSTRQRPKQLLHITDRERTMIQETVARLAPLLPVERVWVVTGAAEAAELRRQLPALRPEQVLVEPCGRNTAPCVALAALHLRVRDPQAVMAVLPADHAITDGAAFRAALAAGFAAAREHAVLLTLGMKPAHPETGYGYIERGEPAADYAGQRLFRVRSFREKPDRQAAAAMLAAGRFLWNAGIFIWSAAVILEEIAQHLPALHAVLDPVGRALAGGRAAGAEAVAAATREAYDGIEGISIDYGVLERSPRVWVMPCAFGWSDVGSWAALHALREQDDAGNAAAAGAAIFVEARNNLVVSADRPVAMLGVDDLVVVVAGQAVLVCPRERAQEVRRIVERLEAEGREELL